MEEKNNFIEQYVEIQKDILNDFSIKKDLEKSLTSFRNKVKYYYGFEDDFGWNIMLNSYYVLNDTELAKSSFKQFELQGPSRHKDIGERYLRLYGLLNAIYQQKIAIENLCEIFKIPHYKTELKNINNSDIIILRNKIASHPSNYQKTTDESEHKFDVYEISRPDLQANKIKLLRNQEHPEEYDLTKSICFFDSLVENILELITAKIITKLFKNQGEYFEKLNRIKLKRNGCIIIADSIIKFKDDIK